MPYIYKQSTKQTIVHDAHACGMQLQDT